MRRIRNRIRNPVYGSKGPDPYRNVTDPEQWLISCSHRSWVRVPQYGRYRYLPEASGH
jgi:hypothetical protein